MLFAMTACKNEYQSASTEKRIEMTERIVMNPGPEQDAHYYFQYSAVELSSDGFRLNATKKDFKQKGLSTYYSGYGFIDILTSLPLAGREVFSFLLNVHHVFVIRHLCLLLGYLWAICHDLSILSVQSCRLISLTLQSFLIFDKEYIQNTSLS